MSLKNRLQECLGNSLLLEEPMSRHTTFRIGGPAVYYGMPKSLEELIQVIRICKEERLPFQIMGNGSNLLFADEGYPGLVIDMTKGFQKVEIEGCQIRVGAGVLLGTLAKKAMAAGLEGLEFASGIPGTVGGAVRMNAGAYGGEIRQILREAKVLTREGEVLSLSAEELDLSYRHSAVAEKGWVVLEAVFCLQKQKEEVIRERMDTLAVKRREKQPLEYPSAGSTFKRPEGYFAAALIDEAGLKGFSVGGAQVSEKHAGFVVNKDHATAADVLNLCKEVQRIVKETFGVELELEVEVVSGCPSLLM